ncbi:hypothetical protein FNV43_RR23133 [Rhamnella rubrinervis]|uniref:Uncharacterized protein n=1 Tax=Rhamnella rubrinervis TaxID=2594499 RepID=A0A8K0DSS5_9ROSA|nr:hypothetical protein FNV43_RR23133 [Rhamnella rubrinervis]
MKRVRFKGLDVDDSCGPDAASVHVEALQPLRCDDAKTSEYAFFKKLKEVAGHKSRSFSLNNDSNQIQAKKLKSRSYFGGDDAKTSEYAFFKKLKEVAGHKSRSFSLNNDSNQIQAKKLKSRSYFGGNYTEMSAITQRPLAMNSFGKLMIVYDGVCPVQRGAGLSMIGVRTSDLNMKNGCTSPDQVHRTHKDMVEYNNALRPEGTQYRHEETFSRKRQKLCQWVASTSFPEIDGLYFKGYKIISALLSRLIPKSDENNNVKDQKMQQLETDAKTMSLASPESDIECNNIQWIPTRSFVENECGPYFGNSISSCWSNTSRGRILYLDSPARPANETHRHYRQCESDSALRGGTPTSCAESDLNLPFRKYGSLGDLKELDLYCRPNKYTPMLDWDFDNTKDEKNLSRACQDIEMKTHWTFLSSWVDDNQYYPSELFSSLNFHNNRESKTPLRLSCLSDYHCHHHQFGRHVLEGKEVIVPDTNHLPVTLLSIANYFSEAEDCRNDTGYEGGSNFFSPRYNYGFIRKAIEGHHCPTTEALLSSEFVSDLGWKCFPIAESPADHFLPTGRALELPGTESISSHHLTNDDYDSYLDGSSSYRGNFSEDNVRIHDHPSFGFQNLMDKEEQAWPLLQVDKSSRDGVEEYLNFEDSKQNTCF